MLEYFKKILKKIEFPNNASCLIYFPILKGPLKGSLWIAGAAAGEGQGLSTIFNLSEQEQVSCAMQLINPNDVCFDIGANVGFYTLLFSKNAKQVVSFEPVPRNLKYLFEMINLNCLKNVLVIPAAVSKESKCMRFNTGENCALGKLDNSGEITVLSVSCDEFIERYNIIPTLIKIDVEGAEVDVLLGATKLLSTHKPQILLSTHGDKCKKDCFEILASFNYGTIQPIDDSRIDEATEFLIKA